jgi:hypothetical protein
MTLKPGIPTRLIGFLALAIPLTLSCGGGGGSGSTIEFTKAAMSALPSVYTSTSGAQSLTRNLSTGTIADYTFLAYLFKQECQALPNDNYCPPTVHPTTDIMDPTRFEMGSLIGMVYHAQMYTGQLVEACSGEGYTPITVTPASYAAHTAAGSDPTKFVLDNYSLYTCRDTHLDKPEAQSRVISTDAAGSYQAALTTRYAYDTGTGGPQTDFFQVYVSMDGISPKFLAFNFSAATPHASRIVLLVNLLSHQFALKYYVPAQDGAPLTYAVATGVGGYDITTGVEYAGYYHVAFSDGLAFQQFCVNNQGGVIQADDTNCTGNSVPISWTSSDAVKTYLGISDADAAVAAPYLAKFQDNQQLTAEDAWKTTGDENLYWPASLQ